MAWAKGRDAVGRRTDAAKHDLDEEREVTNTDARQKVRDIVARALSASGDTAAFRDDEALVTTGRLSSLDVVEILGELEEAFSFEVDVDDFDPSRFESVDSIVAMVRR